MPKLKSKQKGLKTNKSNQETSNEKKDLDTVISPQITFVKEMSRMLHAYGDVSKPLAETCECINDIVYQQVSALLKLLCHIANLRKSNEIGIEDVLYLLRNNEEKLLHFIHHLKFCDTKTKFMVDMQNSSNIKHENKVYSKSMKRMKKCQKFLNCIDVTSDLSTLLHSGHNDPLRLKRLQRAELRTRHMSTDEYLYYSECRSITFSKEKDRFKQWLAPALSEIDTLPNTFGWEAICYLAHETVVELVDIALLTLNDQISTLNVVLHQAQTSANEYRFDTNQSTAAFNISQNNRARAPLQSSHIYEAMRRCSTLFKPENVMGFSMIKSQCFGTYPIVILA